jgi:hypothetical protein
MGSAPAVIFTATPTNGDSDGIERRVFEDLGFKTITYWPKTLPKQFKVCLD